MIDTEASWAGAVTRSAVIGVVVAFVVLTAAVAALALAIGQSFGAAVALGAFAAVWGGPGFGGMFGSVIAIHRYETRAACEAAELASSETQESPLQIGATAGTQDTPPAAGPPPVALSIEGRNQVVVTDRPSLIRR